MTHTAPPNSSSTTSSSTSTTTAPTSTPSLPVGEEIRLPDYEDRPTLLQRGPDANSPLVVVFHGSRGSIENVQKRSGLHLDGPAAGVAVLWLSGKPLPKRSWNTNNRCCDPASTHRVDDMAYIDAALDAVRATGLSPVRIITAGVSNGAGMAVSVACKRPKVFSAAVSVAGWMPVSCRNTSVSLLAIGGTEDDVVGRNKPKQMAKTWRQFVVRCPDDPTKETYGSAHITTWRRCTSSTFVRLVVLDDIGHLWPRFEFYDATADIIRVALGEV
ncbi:MAG: PHB depolymerase family esterase [Actinomycetota bacterium]